jgi:hypothetical protein
MTRIGAFLLGLLAALAASAQSAPNQSAQNTSPNVVPFPPAKPEPPLANRPILIENPSILIENPSMVLSGLAPPPRLSLGVNPSGSTGKSEVNYNLFYSGAQFDTVDASQAPINPATVKIDTNYGGTAKGGRTGLRINVSPSSPMERSGVQVFNVGAEIFSVSARNFGGTNTGPGAVGQLDPVNTVGRAYPGATNLAVVSGFGEMNMAVDAGASAAILNGMQISRLNTDAGEVSRFRAMIFAGTQTPAGASNTIPPMDYGIVWGHDHHQWSFGAHSRMIG